MGIKSLPCNSSINQIRLSNCHVIHALKQVRCFPRSVWPTFTLGESVRGGLASSHFNDAFQFVINYIIAINTDYDPCT